MTVRYNGTQTDGRIVKINNTCDIMVAKMIAVGQQVDLLQFWPSRVKQEDISELPIWRIKAM